MAMKVMADSGGTLTMDAADIGAAFATFACNNDFIIKGIGNEMTVSYTSTSLVFNVKSGIAIICGRPVVIKGTEQLSLPANQTSGVYIVARADLTRPVGQEGYITYVTAAQRKSDNLNNANGIHDLTLGLVKTTSAGVSSWTDQRNIMTAPIDVNAIMNQINSKMSQMESQIDTRINNAISGLAYFPNFNNVITSIGYGGTTSWTATQNCWAYMYRQSYDIRYPAWVTIDGKEAFYAYVNADDLSSANPSGKFTSWVLIKAGSTVSVGGQSGEGKSYVTFYGLK